MNSTETLKRDNNESQQILASEEQRDFRVANESMAFAEDVNLRAKIYNYSEYEDGDGLIDDQTGRPLTQIVGTLKNRQRTLRRSMLGSALGIIIIYGAMGSGLILSTPVAALGIALSVVLYINVIIKGWAWFKGGKEYGQRSMHLRSDRRDNGKGFFSQIGKFLRQE